MKLGTLFDGIGGFPYSAQKYGITPIWASEIEPWPIKVTQKHFPKMKHLGDITKISGAEIEPVDIITFGSPCTRLSVAGRHDGFDITFNCKGNNKSPHELYTNKIRATDKFKYEYEEICPICNKKLVETNESALFFHAIRIIQEMRKVTGGKYPKYIIWENVPGAFSSNKGQDFRAVLSEIGETEIPMPKSNKWASAGMVRTKTADIAWRVLDAQYWGVPQRRRRIFLVADFTGQCAGEILFVEEGLRGDFTESGKTREEVTGDTREGTEKSNCLTLTNVSRTLRANAGMPKHEADWNSLVIEKTLAIRMREGCAGDGKGPLISEEKSLTLGTSNNLTVFTMQRSDEYKESDVSHTLAQRDYKSATDLIIEPRSADGVPRWNTKDLVPTLNTAQGGNLTPCVFGVVTKGNGDAFITKERHTSLTSGGGQAGQGYPCAMVYGISSYSSNAMKSPNPFSGIYKAETTRTLDGNGGNPACNQGGIAICQEKIQAKTFIQQRSDEYKGGDVVSTIDFRDYKSATDLILTPECENAVTSYGVSGFAGYSEGVSTLKASGGDLGGGSENLAVKDFSVRRLTPLECLRLQGFPDDWLDIEGMSDTQKYKAIGNSVAIPCVDFIMQGIAKILKGED